MRSGLKFVFIFIFFVSMVGLGQNKTNKQNKVFANAIVAGDLQTVKKFLKAKIDVNQKFGPNEETPLTLAALNGRGRIVEYLLKRNSDINARTKNGMTALFFASYGAIQGAEKPSFDQPDYTMVVRLLVSSGADVNLKDDQGETALDIAKKNHRSAEILKMLTPP